MTVLEPFPYQQAAIWAAYYSNTYIAFDCGLGKTITAIEAIKLLRTSDHSGPALIVAYPKAARLQWMRVIEQQVPGDAVMMLEDDNATIVKAVADNALARNRLYVVAHYEAVVKHQALLAKIKWLCIVADEAHNINNRQTKRHEAMLKIKAARKIAMSGTYMDKSPSELWGPLHWLDRKRYSSYWDWVEKHVVTLPGYGDHPKHVGTKDGPALAADLKGAMIIRTKKQVAPEMPPLLTTIMPLAIEGMQRKLYDEIKKADDLILQLEDGDEVIIKNTLSKIIKLQQVCSNPVTFGKKYGEDSVKLEWLQAYVEDNKRETMLIFTRFVATAHTISDMLAKAGERHAFVAEGEQANLQQFQSGKLRLCVGTIQSLGTAMDFPFAKTAIFFDQVWSYKQMAQARDRIHRIGITEAKHAIYLVCEGTVEELVLRAIHDKWTNDQMVRAFLTAQEEVSGNQPTNDEGA